MPSGKPFVLKQKGICTSLISSHINDEIKIVHVWVYF